MDTLFIMTDIPLYTIMGIGVLQCEVVFNTGMLANPVKIFCRHMLCFFGKMNVTKCMTSFQNTVSHFHIPITANDGRCLVMNKKINYS